MAANTDTGFTNPFKIQSGMRSNFEKWSRKMGCKDGSSTIHKLLQLDSTPDSELRERLIQWRHEMGGRRVDFKINKQFSVYLREDVWPLMRAWAEVHKFSSMTKAAERLFHGVGQRMDALRQQEGEPFEDDDDHGGGGGDRPVDSGNPDERATTSSGSWAGVDGQLHMQKRKRVDDNGQRPEMHNNDGKELVLREAMMNSRPPQSPNNGLMDHQGALRLGGAGGFLSLDNHGGYGGMLREGTPKAPVGGGGDMRRGKVSELGLQEMFRHESEFDDRRRKSDRLILELRQQEVEIEEKRTSISKKRLELDEAVKWLRLRNEWLQAYEREVEERRAEVVKKASQLAEEVAWVKSRRDVLQAEEREVEERRQVVRKKVAELQEEESWLRSRRETLLAEETEHKKKRAWMEDAAERLRQETDDEQKSVVAQEAQIKARWERIEDEERKLAEAESRLQKRKEQMVADEFQLNLAEASMRMREGLLQEPGNSSERRSGGANGNLPGGSMGGSLGGSITAMLQSIRNGMLHVGGSEIMNIGGSIGGSVCGGLASTGIHELPSAAPAATGEVRGDETVRGGLSQMSGANKGMEAPSVLVSQGTVIDGWANR